MLFQKSISACALAAVIIIGQTSFGATSENAAGWLANHRIEKSVGESKENSDLLWFDAYELTVEGKAFDDTATSYSRLPVSYKKQVTNGVWNTSKCAAGVTVRFVTDSPIISAAWQSPHSAMSHMAWTGSGGMDLYERKAGQWVFAGIGKPLNTTETLNEVLKPHNDSKIPKEYMMFLPSYSTIKSVKLGVEPSASLAAAPDRYKDELPIVYYGTSITQGGCSSRSGMGHTMILQRWLDWPSINLGFSGSGKCEPVMAEILAKIPASIYVIETVENMNAKMIDERVVDFVKNLRKRQPKTPIVMVEGPNATAVSENAAWKKAFEKLQADDITDLHYIPNKGQMTARENGTVDGTHPTDLGFYEMAESYEPVLRDLLEATPKQNPSNK